LGVRAAEKLESDRESIESLAGITNWISDAALEWQFSKSTSRLVERGIGFLEEIEREIECMNEVKSDA
jgi:hypothetical protein